mgnify:CR=1 FL=1
MCRRMRVLCRVWQHRNKRVGGADDERIIIDRSWFSACKQRCTEPVPWNLSIPWSIKKCKNSSRYGRSRCLCYHDFFVCNGADLPVILVPLHFEYLQTIVFILVIAALVQFVEMFLKKANAAAVSGAGSLPASDYNQLCGTRSCTDKCAEIL